jgi:hypothetical protein
MGVMGYQGVTAPLLCGSKYPTTRLSAGDLVSLATPIVMSLYQYPPSIGRRMRDEIQLRYWDLAFCVSCLSVKSRTAFIGIGRIRRAATRESALWSNSSSRT